TRPARPAELVDRRALVVDDNSTNRRILREMLFRWGLRPAEAVGAEEALTLMRHAHSQGEPFHLLLSDVNMPVADGFELAERVLHDPTLENTAIVMLTSGTRGGDVARCEELGVSAHLM